MMTSEAELRRPFDQMEAQCRQLCEDILKPDFDGFMRLDPTLNKAIVFLHLSDEVIVRFAQGSFPLHYASGYVRWILRLLHRCRSRYGREKTKAMEQVYHAHLRLWFYKGAPMLPSNLFAKKLFDLENKLVESVCAHNAGIIEKPTNTGKSPRNKVLKRGMRGRKTPFMEQQLKSFTTFVSSHPITPSCKAASRARQCWLEHQAEWDLASSQGSGYSSYKSLSRAYLAQ